MFHSRLTHLGRRKIVIMARAKKNKGSDRRVAQVRDVLAEYRQAHPNAKIDVYRQNVVSIRIRIIDRAFEGIDRVDREGEVWAILEKLPEDVRADITFLLLLTPEETSQSLANMEFENPIPSRL